MTPKEFTEALEMFDAWSHEQQLRTGSNVMGRAAATMERLRNENIRLTGTVGELKADLDRANTTIASLCESNHRLAQENETLALQVPPVSDECDNLIQRYKEKETRQASTIRDLRDLLTSAYAIAARGGEDTNWEAFINQPRDRGIGSNTAKVFRKPKENAVFWNPDNGVVQDHRDGTIVQPDTDKERAKRGLPPFTPDTGPQKLRDRIKHAINCTSAENESDTPDFILADYLMASLDAFDAATRTREKWYGREQKSVDDLSQVTETPAS